MQPAGFSTGAIARGDIPGALQALATTDADAVELSALRIEELPRLIETLRSLDLHQYRHVSVHAPSAFRADEEAQVLTWLQVVADMGLPIVAHPDAMYDVRRWAALRNCLLLENMDKRKPTGRTAKELASFFEQLPEAGMCFDIAHARQVDGSMTEAYRLLRRFASRIRQIHVSEVTSESRHARMSPTAEADYREVATLVPDNAAIIVESPVAPADMISEFERARALFGTPAVA